MKIELTHTIDMKSIIANLSDKEREKVVKMILKDADLLSLQKLYTEMGVAIQTLQKEERERKAREKANEGRTAAELLTKALS